jgi:hypothetical protein
MREGAGRNFHIFILKSEGKEVQVDKQLEWGSRLDLAVTQEKPKVLKDENNFSPFLSFFADFIPG